MSLLPPLRSRFDLQTCNRSNISYNNKIIPRRSFAKEEARIFDKHFAAEAAAMTPAGSATVLDMETRQAEQIARAMECLSKDRATPEQLAYLRALHLI